MPDIINEVKNKLTEVKDKLTFEKVLIKAMHTPGVQINRANFLHKELIKYCSEDIVNEAIESNPAKAGISKETINKISKQVINYETTKVTSISVAAGLPGGVAAVGAAVADITSYFAFILRTVQELAYLYGFEQFDLDEDNIDAETMNFLLLFMGVMFGVQGTANVLKKFADLLAKHVAKKLGQKALTKGAIYPIVKKIALNIGIRMTRQIFADGVASTIPIIGGALSAGLTYAILTIIEILLMQNLLLKIMKMRFDLLSCDSLYRFVLNFMEVCHGKTVILFSKEVYSQ